MLETKCVVINVTVAELILYLDFESLSKIVCKDDICALTLGRGNDGQAQIISRFYSMSTSNIGNIRIFHWILSLLILLCFMNVFLLEFNYNLPLLALSEHTFFDASCGFSETKRGFSLSTKVSVRAWGTLYLKDH